MVEANGILDQNGIEKGGFLDSPVHSFHKIAKGKHATKTLPWDDDSVIVVNVTNKPNIEMSASMNGDPVRHQTQVPGSSHSQTLPRASSSYNSPLRQCLNPGDITNNSPSPSGSPRLRKRNNNHHSNTGPVKPGAIDNSQLTMPNTSKVITAQCCFKFYR